LPETLYGEAKMRTSIIVFIFLTVFASTTAAQNPAKTCQQYAKDAVRYQQHNRKSGCGLRGPQWNDNFRYHYNWCVQGNNWRSAANWTAWRHKLISDCQRAKAPMKVVPLAKTYKSQKNVWHKRINHLEKDLSARLNHGMTAIRNKSYKGKAKFLKIKTVPITGVLLASPSWGGKQRAQFDQTYKSALTRARLDPKKLHIKPKIKSVVSTPRNGRVEPGSFLLISGANFGKKPGRVYLRYQVGRETQATEFRKQEKVTKTITLLPYTGSWAKSWYSNLVVVKVNQTYSDPALQADRTGQLLLVLPDGTRAMARITIGAGSPEIVSVQTKGGNNWIRPGEIFTISGYNFGNKPGKVSIYLSQSANKKWLRVKGTTHYVYWPTRGPQPAGTVGLVKTQVLSWSDRSIKLRAGHYKSKYYFGGTTASLIMKNRKGRSGIRNKMWYGPDTEVKMVSGYRWLEAKSKKTAKPTQNGGAMLITHKPSCGDFSSSGEKGWDRFFADVPWPSDVEVIAFDFKQINLKDPYNDLDFFMDQASEILNALDSGPFGVGLYIGKKILRALFSGGGGYHAYVASAPGGYSWTHRGTRSIGIRWESSCDLDGKPIIYVVSFTITGTKQALAKY
jgi:hypothetical protein